jgi:Trypsin-like peptidase domain
LHDDRTRFQISAPVQPGNSGGPVLDKSGNVVGMVVSKLNVLRIARMTGDIPQNVNFAIPASIITSVLNANSVKYLIGTPDGGKSAAEVVSGASPGVVSLECQGRERVAATKDVPASRTPPVRDGYGAIAWDEESGKRGWSWNQATAELALSECGATLPISPANGREAIIGPWLRRPASGSVALYFAASSPLLFCSSAAKCRSTALAAAALRLALNASRLSRIQSIDCERQALRSSKRGNT